MKSIQISLLLAGVALMAGCPSKSGPTGDACKQDTDCKTGFVCTDSVCTDYLDCTEIQATDKACKSNERCDLTASGAVCSPETGCRVSSDCNSGQFCVAGACGARPTTAIASCEVTNGQRAFAPGASVQIQAAAYDAAGHYIPHQEFTVATDGGFTTSGNTVTASDQSVATTQHVTVTFTNGGVACPEAIFTNLGTVADGTTRVTLYKTAPMGSTTGSEAIAGLGTADIFFTNSAGAKLTAAVTALTGASAGSYTLPTPASSDAAYAITIANDGYNYNTVYWGANTATKHDVVLPLEPFHSDSKKGDISGYAGTPSFTAYDAAIKQAPGVTQLISGAYAGSSLPFTAFFNFNLSLFAGDTANFDQQALIGAFTGGGCTTPRAADATGTIPLPRALYLANTSGAGVGPNCGGYAARVTPGRRIAWSLGLKLPFDQILNVVKGGLDLTSILKGVIPLIDTITLGVHPFAHPYLDRQTTPTWTDYVVKSITEQTGDMSKFQINNIAPANRMLNIVNFANPGIAQDTFIGSTAADKMGGMITLVTALSPAFGIVPVGFGAGFDAVNNGDANNKTPDGKLDLLSTDPRFAPDTVHVRHTYLSSDVADAEVIGVTVAANFDDLFKSDTDATKKAKATRVRGLITRDRTKGIGWAKTTASLGDMNSTVKAYAMEATGPKYGLNGDVLTLPALSPQGTGPDADVVLVRLDRADNSSERVWNILIAPGAIGAANVVLNIATMRDLFDGGTSTGVDTGSVALKFSDTQSFEARLSPAYGRDLDTIASDTKSFQLYLDTAEKLQ